MTHPSTHVPKKINRIRELNVIYFVDSAKTRSFKLSLGKVKILAGVIALVAIWALGSFWVLVKMWNGNEHANKRITEYQSTIFEFQTRYAQVYETAYPKSQTLAESIEQAEKIATTDAEPEETQPSDEKTLAAKPIAATPAPTAVQKEPEPPVDKPTVTVENTRFSASGDNLVLSFAIRNTITPKQALGYMWGVASYTANSGDTLYVAFPRSVKVDKAGHATRSRNATRYNIRRFKPVKITFPAPQGVPGKFENVKVTVMDQEGNRSAYDLPVSIRVGFTAKPAPTPEPALKSEPSNATTSEPTIEDDTATEGIRHSSDSAADRVANPRTDPDMEPDAAVPTALPSPAPAPAEAIIDNDLVEPPLPTP